MQNTLPEINFKEKKEKKGGFLGWLRARAGFYSRGGMGELGVNHSVMNFGRALGTGGFGTSQAGLSGFLAANIGTIAAAAVLSAAGAVYLTKKPPSAIPNSAAFTRGRSSSNYMPAILRSQAANNGSSLEMLKEASKAFIKEHEQDAKPVKSGGRKPQVSDQAPDPDQNQPAQEQAGALQDMMGQLQSGDIGALTSSLGGGSDKFSGLGGFANKFGEGQTGARTGFSSGIGSGFSSMPRFGESKSKLLALKGTARPVFSSSKSGKYAKAGPGALGQAKSIRATQSSYTGSKIDSMRSTQDKAWEGSTAEGAVSSGAGLGKGGGGAGIMTSPSLDNAVSGGVTGSPENALPPNASAPINVSPWAGLLSKAMMLILLSAVLSAIGARLIKIGRKLMGNPHTAALGMMLYMIGITLCITALMMGIMATMIGMQVMTSSGQMLLGSVYVLGGGVAVAGAVMGMTGSSMGAITPLWMSAIAGVIALMASMFAQ